MSPLLLTTAILACIWILAMGWMRRGFTPGRPKLVQTDQGLVWVECQALPNPGTQITTYGHPAERGQAYDRQQAQRGTLRAHTGGYGWETAGRKRYA